jgi:hypothetical protein
MARRAQDAVFFALVCHGHCENRNGVSRFTEPTTRLRKVKRGVGIHQIPHPTAKSETGVPFHFSQ